MGLALFRGLLLAHTDDADGQDRVALSFLFVLTVAIILTHRVSFITLVMLRVRSSRTSSWDWTFRLDPTRRFRINQPVNIAGPHRVRPRLQHVPLVDDPYKGRYVPPDATELPPGDADIECGNA